MSSGDTFTMGKNLATDTSSNESLPMYASSTSPPAVVQKKYRATDLRMIRHFARTHRITLKDAVESIALSIIKVAQDNDNKPCAPTDFDAQKPPKVDLVWYLWRIVNDLNAMKEPILFRNDGSAVDLLKEGSSSPVDLKFDDSALGRGVRCLLFALVYIDRMSQQNRQFMVNSKNIHRIMLGTMYLAHKFSDDSPFKLSHFALLGGVSTEELKRIESAVCSGLEFNFYISEAEFRVHALAQLNFAVKGANQRKLRLRREAKNAVAQVVDKRAQTIEDGVEYGLGGSTPLMTNQKRLVLQNQRG